MIRAMPWPQLKILTSALLLIGAVTAQAQRPNVLLISIDDLNDWVGALGGHPQAQTPNLDRLAGRGTLFSNAHCQAPVCAPSRASLATGRMPSSTGMYFLTPSLAEAADLRATPTLVERFAAEGYETMGVGKIHHGDEVPFFDRYGGSMGGFGPRPKQKLAYKIGHPLWDWGAYPQRDEQMPDARDITTAIMKSGIDLSVYDTLTVGAKSYSIVDYSDNNFVIEAQLSREVK